MIKINTLNINKINTLNINKINTFNKGVSTS